MVQCLPNYANRQHFQAVTSKCIELHSPSAFFSKTACICTNSSKFGLFCAHYVSRLIISLYSFGYLRLADSILCSYCLLPTVHPHRYDHIGQPTVWQRVASLGLLPLQSRHLSLIAFALFIESSLDSLKATSLGENIKSPCDKILAKQHHWVTKLDYPQHH